MIAMDQLPNNLLLSEELQDAIKQLESCTTEQLEIMAKELSESNKPLYGRNEIYSAVVILLKGRRAFGAPLN